MRVKIEDVAKRARVSTATVSLAMNGSDKVSAKTRERIEAIAREMGYQPNPNAQRLAMRRSRQIGLVVPDIENTYYAALAQCILNELLASDYAQRVLLVDADSQCNLTEFFGADPNVSNLADVLRGDAPAIASIQRTAMPGVDILPGSDALMDLDLTKVELQAVSATVLPSAPVTVRLPRT